MMSHIDIRSQLRALGVLVTSLLLLAAQPAESWLRRGNAAYDRGDYTAAVEAYSRAATLATDPGSIAFNRAAAHYQAEDFNAAELDYTRALEDAAGVRRVKALYGLGNALAQQGARLHGRAAVRKLLAAQKAYRACLAEEQAIETSIRDACSETFADARFNLQLLDPLLARKQQEAATEPPPPPSSEEGPNERGGPERRNGSGEPGSEPAGGGSRTRPDRRHGNTGANAAGSERPRDPQSPSPGKGNLPQVSDEPGGPALDADAAQAALQAHLDRIRRERSQRQGSPPAAVRQVRDW